MLPMCIVTYDISQRFLLPPPAPVTMATLPSNLMVGDDDIFKGCLRLRRIQFAVSRDNRNFDR